MRAPPTRRNSPDLSWPTVNYRFGAPSVCTPSSTAPDRYYCPKCKIVHCGDCALTVIPTVDEMQKTRPCKDCRATAAAGGKQSASKRRQSQDDDDDDDGAASRTGQGRAKKKGKAADSPKKNAVNPLPSSPGAENDVKVARR